MNRTSIYYLTMIVAGLVGLGKSVVYALLLGPDEFGFFNVVQITSTAVLFIVSAGLIEGLSLTLPKLYGRKLEAEAVVLTTASAVRFLLLAMAVAVVCSIVAALTGYLLIIVLAFSLAATSGLLSILISEIRSKGDLLQFGVLSLSRAILALVLGPIGASLAGATGTVIGEVLGQLLLASVVWGRLYSRTRTLEQPKSVTEISALRTVGWPMLAFQFFQLLQMTLDRWIIFFALGTAALGQYSLAAISLIVAGLIHATLYQQLGPEAVRNHAADGSWSNDFIRISKFSAGAAGLVLIGGISAFVICQFFLDSLLSEYVTAIEIMPWMILAAAFQVGQLFDWIVAGAGRMQLLARIGFTIAVLQIGLAIVGALTNQSLHYFAVITLGGRFATLLASYVMARKISLEHAD